MKLQNLIDSRKKILLFLGGFLFIVFVSALYATRQLWLPYFLDKNQPASPVQEIKEQRDISKTPDSQIKMRDELLAMLDPNDSGSVYKIVDRVQADKNLSLICHDIAHDIGHRAYQLYGFSGAVNFSKATPTKNRSVQDICAGGYMHGVLEEASLHQVDFLNDPASLCLDTKGITRTNCFHGIGHALMFAYGRDTKASLAGCRNVGYIVDTTRCFEGVWMEFFWGKPASTDKDELGWDLTKPLLPCKETGIDAKPACYLYSVFGYLRTHKKDYIGAVALCTKSSLDESDTHFCMKGIGITMVSNFGGHNLERAEMYAENLDDNQKLGFYQGVLGYGMLSGVYKNELESTCDKLEHDKDICKQALTRIR